MQQAEPVQSDLVSQKAAQRNIMSPRTLHHLRANGKQIMNDSKASDASGLYSPDARV